MQNVETRFGNTPIPAAEIAPRMGWEYDEPFNPDAAVAGDPLPVLGNHGRWVVECDHCPSAQLAARTDPRFMCVTCGNAYQDGAWRPVVWPEDPDDLAVLLNARPVQLANWIPGETVDDLTEQNRQLVEAQWSLAQVQANEVAAALLESDQADQTEQTAAAEGAAE